MMTSSREFSFAYKKGEKTVSITEIIEIPLSVITEEYGHQLIKRKKIPLYAEENLLKELKKFVQDETDKYFSKQATAAIKALREQPADMEKLVKKWSKAFREEHVDYAKIEPVMEDDNFPEMYHRLIHSPALETMLNLEHSYAVAVGDLVHRRDTAIRDLQMCQADEMENAVPQVGITCTDKDINEMATRHFEEMQHIVNSWDRKISLLKETQKKEFREWVGKVHEDYQSGCGSPGYLQRVRALSEATPYGDSDWTPQPQRMEESFTIHLGSQLKMMHNLRLMSADVLDLCRHKLNKVGGVVVPQPQRLQTAISLYSNNLSGLVLLVDNRINSYVGVKKDFASVCQMSTEFHFLDIEQQLEVVREQAQKAAEWRHNVAVGDTSSQSSSDKSSSPSDHTSPNTPLLKTGDFYITRHSNLSEVHVVFHLVTDDTLRSAEINSRHPVILGLRNVLRVAHERDICTITIPLLLVHEMSEEMTIPWCMKRAELIFKCIKGFMIEMASLVGDETRTLQFLMPKGISEQVFSKLSTQLSEIFRISNPLVLKSR